VGSPRQYLDCLNSWETGSKGQKWERRFAGGDQGFGPSKLGYYSSCDAGLFISIWTTAWSGHQHEKNIESEGRTDQIQRTGAGWWKRLVVVNAMGDEGAFGKTAL